MLGSTSISRRVFGKQLGALAVLPAGMSGVRTLFADSQKTKTAESSGRMIVHTDVPRNSEPPLEDLITSWLTPVDRFYVRSHAPVPELDADKFRLTVEGLVHEPLVLSLAELKDLFPAASAIATLTCAGNRRSEHSLVKEVSGVPWREGAIGNARWGGVRLSDVLKKAGLKENARHVWFEGLDRVDHKEMTIPFGGSIPVEKAMADLESMPGALLATQMNEKPLTGDHGFPLRTVVPGYIGARSVKWLGRIVVSDRPSPNHYVADAYKLVDEDAALEWAEAGPIYRYPVNAVICTPRAGAKLQAGRLMVQGYALPSGKSGTTISRVELSIDGGRTWERAQLAKESSEFTWMLWQAEVAVNNSTRELIVRATDSAGNTQPARLPWNLKGYLFNAWHRVAIEVS